MRDLVEQRTGARPLGPIRLLTQLRSFGHCFNPVSFYYCFDPAGELAQEIVAEVTNTPWGERHAYVLPARRGLKGDSEKVLHVSPFMGMDHEYDWRATDARRDARGAHRERAAGERAFDATLNLRPPRAQPPRASRAAPLDLRTVALIYAHASRLKLKGARVHPHPPEAT